MPRRGSTLRERRNRGHAFSTFNTNASVKPGKLFGHLAKKLAMSNASNKAKTDNTPGDETVHDSSATRGIVAVRLKALECFNALLTKALLQRVKVQLLFRFWGGPPPPAGARLGVFG